MKSTSLLFSSLLLLGGCAELPHTMTKVADTLQELGKNAASAAPGAPVATPFSASALPLIFKNTADGARWPRVALTIVDMPANSDFTWMGWGMGGYVGVPRASLTVPPANFCIVVSAVVWKSEKVSEQVPPVPFCGRDTRQRAVSDDYYGDLLGWAQVAKNTPGNTGTARTAGPNAPLKSFPPRSIVIGSASSQGGLMFAHLVAAMGLELAADPLHEARLWVVKTKY